jgi:hypothetical protein
MADGWRFFLPRSVVRGDTLSLPPMKSWRRSSKRKHCFFANSLEPLLFPPGWLQTNTGRQL